VESARFATEKTRNGWRVKGKAGSNNAPAGQKGQWRRHALTTRKKKTKKNSSRGEGLYKQCYKTPAVKNQKDKMDAGRIQETNCPNPQTKPRTRKAGHQQETKTKNAGDERAERGKGTKKN